LTAARELKPRVPKAALPALLLGPLASAYLRRLSDRHYDLFSSELDIAKPRRQVLLAWSAWRGRY
jgi:phytoene/squalene synthetase